MPPTSEAAAGLNVFWLDVLADRLMAQKLPNDTPLIVADAFREAAREGQSAGTSSRVIARLFFWADAFAALSTGRPADDDCEYEGDDDTDPVAEQAADHG